MIRLPLFRSSALSQRTRNPVLRAVLLTGLTVGTAFGLAGCAAPPLRLYTLGMPSDENSSQPNRPSLSSRAETVAVSNVVIPDYLDSQDMVVRRGEEIVRSPRSRWATRLSIGITDLIANEMAGFHPSMLITDQPLADAATMRVQVDISRFDVDMNGQATLDAHWAILPADPRKPLIRDRAHLTMTGPVTTDADVAALMRKMVILLADKVNADLPVSSTAQH